MDWKTIISNPWILGGGVIVAAFFALTGSSGSTGSNGSIIDPRDLVDLERVRIEGQTETALASFNAQSSQVASYAALARTQAEVQGGIVNSAVDGVARATMAAYSASAEIERSRSVVASDYGVAQINAWRDVAVADIGRRIAEEANNARTTQSIISSVTRVASSVLGGK